MVIYLVIIIIAILTAIIGTLIINDKRDERIKDMVDQIIVEIETDEPHSWTKDDIEFHYNNSSCARII